MEPADEILNAYTIVFEHLAHLGPGDTEVTRRLVEQLSPGLPSGARVADFGCGAGASTLVLAHCLPAAHILALDSHAPFIERLERTASTRGLADRISAIVGDMADPPPLDGVAGEFDLIWSESAIYSIGRSRAFECWRPLLKPGGWLVFSDIVWQREATARPDKTSAFWKSEYPDISTIPAVMDELTAAGFKPLDPVPSSQNAWSNYYEPLRNRIRQLKTSRDCSGALVNLIAELEREIDVYDCAGNEVGLYFFLVQRNPVSE